MTPLRPPIDASGTLELTRSGVVVQDAQRRVIYANAAAIRMLGMGDWSPSDLGYEPTWTVVHPDGREVRDEDRPSARVLAEGRAVHGVVLGVWRPRSEDRLWVIVDGEPHRDERGQIDAVVLTLRDITHELSEQQQLTEVNTLLEEVVASRTAELKQVVQALREAQTSYKAVIRSMAEGIAIHDQDGRIIEANPAAQQILGLTLVQMQGRHPVSPEWRLSHPDGSPLEPDQIPSEISQRTGVACRDVMLGVRRGDGERAWLSVNTVPVVREGETRPSQVVATFSDVTAEREAVDQLAANRDRLLRLTEAVPGVLLEHCLQPGGEEKYTYISPQAEDILGIAPERLRSEPKSLLERIHPDDRSRFHAARERAIAARRAYDEELRMGPFDGEWRWIRHRSGIPVKTPTCFVIRAIALDVTEQHEMAERLEAAQRREATGLLVSGIAHNFNNMLSVIVPNLELAREKAPPEIERELDDALRAAIDAADLVGQLALMTRQESSAGQQFTELSEVISEVLRFCRKTFDRRLRLELDLADGLVLVPGRRSELMQVILNLCLNARDALEGVEEPRLSVSLAPEGDKAVVHITDNGHGMSPETSKRLGEPFFTTKAAGKGTGIGLASCLQTVEGLGGALEWSSTLGSGSRFELRLPLASAGSTRAEVPRAPAVEAAEGRLLLVIDDEQMVRETLRRMLEHGGYRVLCAADGRSGLQLLEQLPELAAVFVDLSMPGMSGAEVLAEIRARRRELPVAILSGWVPEPGTLREANVVLHKPISSALLREALATLLAASHAEG